MRVILILTITAIKRFMGQAQVANVIKHFCLRFTNFHAKLECLSE
jgi:hypothetical protein